MAEKGLNGWWNQTAGGQIGASNDPVKTFVNLHIPGSEEMRSEAEASSDPLNLFHKQRVWEDGKVIQRGDKYTDPEMEKRRQFMILRQRGIPAYQARAMIGMASGGIVDMAMQDQMQRTAPIYGGGMDFGMAGTPYTAQVDPAMTVAKQPMQLGATTDQMAQRQYQNPASAMPVTQGPYSGSFAPVGQTASPGKGGRSSGAPGKGGQMQPSGNAYGRQMNVAPANGAPMAPPGLDQRAINADPAGYQRWQAEANARQQQQQPGMNYAGGTPGFYENMNGGNGFQTMVGTPAPYQRGPTPQLPTPVGGSSAGFQNPMPSTDPRPASPGKGGQMQQPASPGKGGSSPAYGGGRSRFSGSGGYRSALGGKGG